MREQLKKIKSIQKRPDGIFGTYMTRPFSHVFAYFAYRLNMSPNLVSLLSFFFCMGTVILLLKNQSYISLIFASLLWWIAAILDAADGDLARFSGSGSNFGAWFDSLLDRMKEFIIFGVFGYLAVLKTGNDIFYLLAFLSVFSTVMSGWISDTKKLFIEKREPSLKFGKKYIFGMADTRDFFIILSLILNNFTIALYIYSTVFMIAVLVQMILFYRRYGQVQS